MRDWRRVRAAALRAGAEAPVFLAPGRTRQAGVDRAFAKLDQLKANLIWWEKGSQPPQLLASGEAAMVDAYNGRIAAANDKDKKNFKIVWTNNLYTIDSWVIMKGTPNKADAEKYLVFVNDPNNQKNLPPRIPYGVTTKAATALIDKNVLPNLATAPEKLNQDPHGEAWLVKIRLTAPDETKQLLSAADYRSYLGAEN